MFAYDFRDEKRQAPHYWRDIGTIDAYYAASMDVIDDGSLGRRPRNSAAWRPALVSSASKVTQSVLSAGVQVEPGATVCRSVLLPGVHIGKDVRLQRAIVEEGVHIPAGFRAGFDLDEDRKLHTVTRSGIVVIGSPPVASKTVTVVRPFQNARKVETSRNVVLEQCG